MTLSHLSKRDFFKLLGGGSAVAAIATGSAAGSTPEVVSALKKSVIPIKDPYENPNVYDFRPYMIDICPWILYGRFTGEDFEKEDGVVRIFTKACYPYSRLETNLEMPYSFPAPSTMVVGGIMALLDRDVSDADASEFEHNVYGELHLGQKIYQSVPMSRMTARASLDQLVRRDSLGRDGEPSEFVTAKMYRCDPPHVISTGMMFYYCLIGRSIPKGVAGYILFDGVIARSVQ